jgi:hypothetical protein
MAAVGAAADDLLLRERYHTGDVPAWEGLVADIRSRGEATDRSDLAVSGSDLIAAGCSPGPALGTLLDRLLDAVLADPALNTRDRLMTLVQTWH